MAMRASLEETVTLANPMRGFELTVPSKWSVTEVFPSRAAPEFPPDVDFGFSLHPSTAAVQTGGCIGVWANQQPPQSMQFPQVMFLAHPLPALQFDSFVQRMRAKLEALNGTEIESRAGLSLGHIPAGEYVYALGARRVRLRVAWHSGHRYAVFFAGDARAQLAAASAFETVANGVRIRSDLR